MTLLGTLGRASVDTAASALGVSLAATPAATRPNWRHAVWRILGRMGEPTFTLAAAGVAFYAFLAIFPSIAVMVSLYGLVMDPTSVAVQTAQLDRFLPPAAAQLIGDALHNFSRKNTYELNAGLAIGFVLAVYSARAGVASLMGALNLVFAARETRSFLKQQFIAVTLTLAAVVVGIGALVVTSILPLVLGLLPPSEADFKALLIWLRWPLLAVVVAAGFSTIYKFAPCRPRARWRPTLGAMTATGFWIVGSSLFSIYVSMSHSYDAIYGSLSAVVVLLVWLWVTAMVLLGGAVIDAERERLALERAGSVRIGSL